MKKRLRAIKAKPGELKLAWSKLPHEKPDICFAWGDGCSKRDGNFLCHHFTGHICRPNYEMKGPFGFVFDKSFVDELKERGYDITTMKFSIQKAEAPPSTPKPPGQSEEAV